MSKHRQRRVAVTLAEAKQQLGLVFMTLSKRDGEYRVDFARGCWGSEYPKPDSESAYFTDWLDDAVKTGVDMARRAEASGRRTR